MVLASPIVILSLYRRARLSRRLCSLGNVIHGNTGGHYFTDLIRQIYFVNLRLFSIPAWYPKERAGGQADNVLVGIAMLAFADSS